MTYIFVVNEVKVQLHKKFKNVPTTFLKYFIMVNHQFFLHDNLYCMPGGRVLNVICQIFKFLSLACKTLQDVA